MLNVLTFKPEIIWQAALQVVEQSTVVMNNNVLLDEEIDQMVFDTLRAVYGPFVDLCDATREEFQYVREIVEDHLEKNIVLGY